MWGVCFERVEVRRYLGLSLLPNLKWKIFASFAMYLKFFEKEK
jgi:hypothetical protein